jgi:succinate dehydrogenase hydrophobic anchor subunit
MRRSLQLVLLCYVPICLGLVLNYGFRYSDITQTLLSGTIICAFVLSPILAFYTVRCALSEIREESSGASKWQSTVALIFGIGLLVYLVYIIFGIADWMRRGGPI